MLIYNKDKDKILDYYDLEKGYLIDDILVIHHEYQEEIKEQGHSYVKEELEDGTHVIDYVIDIPYQEAVDAYDEKMNIKVYIPYNEIELKINELKSQLNNSDYKAIKYAEGYYTDEEYKPIKEQRQKLRDQINELQKELEK